MSKHPTDQKNERTSAFTPGLPVSTSLGAPHGGLADSRTVLIGAVAIALAFIASFIAVILTKLIGLVTNLSFYGRFSSDFVSPADNHLGLWVVIIPVLGAVIVGIMARYGSKAIRGHGIPEAMEQILLNESKIPARITFLKPLSAAVSIGTGGPFGAEGPIIATGGALGSVIGQLLKTTASERKTLLAAGAAAGMTATFGSPISAVILAIELLLFEFRPRTFIPVALATVTAAATRGWLVGTHAAFSMPALEQPSAIAVIMYSVEGILIGLAAVAITKAVYWIEDQFEHLPIHWMWWPAVGALAVGVIGYFSPHTLGVGYDNIDHILSGDLVGTTLAVFFVLKFISWSISLGSGTSGGTLAPLFTVGGGLGATLGAGAIALFPGLGLDVRMAALVGMAATFAGASRALFASVIFAFETTHQYSGLLPLLGGCTTSYLISALIMRQTIMTEKISRRGTHVPMEYASDPLEKTRVSALQLKDVVVLLSSDSLQRVRSLILGGEPKYQHQGFPIVQDDGTLCGVLTRSELLNARQSADTLVGELVKRSPVMIGREHSLRNALDLMLRENIGRLPVVDSDQRVMGILTRQDIFDGHKNSHREMHHAEVSWNPTRFPKSSKP